MPIMLRIRAADRCMKIRQLPIAAAPCSSSIALIPGRRQCVHRRSIGDWSRSGDPQVVPACRRRAKIVSIKPTIPGGRISAEETRAQEKARFQDPGIRARRFPVEKEII